MSTFELDPKHHVDRQTEKQLFTDLLLLAGEARVLAIKDKGGMGKSSLLKWFNWHCTWSADVPCSLTSLTEHTDHTPYGLVSSIRSGQFEALDFPRYDDLDHARADGDFRPFRGQANGGTGAVRANSISGSATVVGSAKQVGGVYVEAPRNWTPEQEAFARRDLVEAFFDDVAEATAQRPLVIMLDAFERCSEPLRSWVRDRLLRAHVVSEATRCHGLVVVLAGRDLPELHELPDEVLERFVRTIETLSRWEKDHVLEFLKLYKFDPTDEIVDAIQKLISGGVTLVSALQVASQLQPAARG